MKTFKELKYILYHKINHFEGAVYVYVWNILHTGIICFLFISGVNPKFSKNKTIDLNFLWQKSTSRVYVEKSYAESLIKLQ